MYDVIKKWYWYDWMVFAVRFIWLLSILIGLWRFHHTLSFSYWILLGLSFIAFSVPFFIQQFYSKYFVLAEIFVSGSYCIFFSFLLHEALWQFIPVAFVIGFYSFPKIYMASGPLTIVIIPFIIGMATNRSLTDTVLSLMFNYGIAFGLGYAFQLLVTNHKQGLIIRDQNNVLEQYVVQVEQLALLEERNRLSRELHDTVGHTFTTMILGMESIRSSVADERAQHKLNALLDSTRHGLNEMRQLVHQLEPSKLDASLIQLAKQLIGQFMESTDASVKLRNFGEEYLLPKEVKLTVIRCIQEALTNAVRHGHASEIKVYLYFDSVELRLQVEDNGATEGGNPFEFGFGLSAMRERLHALHGELSIHADSVNETVVICTIPRKVEKSDDTIKIVLVDDQHMVLESLGTALESQGHLQIVGMADSGEDALLLCSQIPQDIDIVLMDVHLPNMSGIEALEALKKKNPMIKVVMLSSYENVAQAVEALQKGANGYLLKTIPPKELIETLHFINRGDTIISHEIANQVFDEMKKQKVSNEETLNHDYGLTSRELEIINYLAKGMRYKAIAARLYLSEGTVRNYASEMYAKLEVRNRDQAIQKCLEKGLIS